MTCVFAGVFPRAGIVGLMGVYRVSMMSTGLCKICQVERSGAMAVAEKIMAQYPFSRFRQHKLFGEMECRKLHFDSIINADVSGDATFFTVEGSAGELGLLKLFRLNWDSNHFGVPMYRIEFCHNAVSVDAWAALGGALEETLAASVIGGHVDAIVDHDDYLWLNALLDARFNLYDSKSVYICRGASNAAGFRAPFLCRQMVADDVDSVLDILSATQFPARFTRDPFFLDKKDKVAEMYKSWVLGLMHREYQHDPVLVVEKQGQVVAFGAGKTLSAILDSAGKRVCGNSLFFSSPTAVGSYPSLVHYLTENTRRHFDALELGASLSNYAAIRVLERLGLQVAGGSHALSRSFQ